LSVRFAEQHQDCFARHLALDARNCAIVSTADSTAQHCTKQHKPYQP